jgi:hypothetical protein
MIGEEEELGWVRHGGVRRHRGGKFIVERAGDGDCPDAEKRYKARDNSDELPDTRRC